jgi:adenine-specific DNA-methyltransferase
MTTGNTKNRLELTWIGKQHRPRLEPRILLEDAEKSHHAKVRRGKDDRFDNRLIFGDNLLALKALEAEFAGKIKCIYIDPPYNTGSAFEYYDDGVEHSLWLSLMRDRLEILRRLLAEEGSIFVQIDDNEGSYLQVLLDEVFGRRNRVLTVSVKRSAATGHKTINPTPVNVSEYIHIYAMDKPRWTYKPQWVARGDYDWAYSIRLENPTDPHTLWRFEPLGEHVARTFGFETAKLAKKALGKKAFDDMFVTYALTNPHEVVRYAQPNYAGVSKAAQSLIDASKMNAGKVLRLERDGYSDMYFKAGNRILFLADKVDGEGEEAGIVEPLTNWWDDIPWQGIAREGGVEFPKSKKPEKLIKRILDIATNPGDWVLDSFAGSGTTGAVAHTMGRRWIRVELGEHCHTHIIPRLTKVIDGTDPGGVTEATGWKGGGGFRYSKLAPSLLEKDAFGNWVINKKYNAAMLAEAVCKLEGFRYEPSDTVYWQHGRSTETDFAFITTQTMSLDMIQKLADEVGDQRTLAVYCPAFRVRGGRALTERFPNLTIKKIPKAVLAKCEWGRDDYSLEVRNLPMMEPDDDPPPGAATPAAPGTPGMAMSRRRDLSPATVEGGLFASTESRPGTDAAPNARAEIRRSPRPPAGTTPRSKTIPKRRSSQRKGGR